MTLIPKFPTKLHSDAAEIIRDYFLPNPNVDTVLIVNSCARGTAVPESDLDFAILVKPGTSITEIQNMEKAWQKFNQIQATLLAFKQSSRFSHLHIDIISGTYTPTILEVGVASDYFEIEIGNHICYSVPMNNAGPYFQNLQKIWLPYYN